MTSNSEGSNNDLLPPGVLHDDCCRWHHSDLRPDGLGSHSGDAAACQSSTEGAIAVLSRASVSIHVVAAIS